MRYIDLVWKYFVIIGMGILMFYLDDREFFDYKITLTIICLLSFLKSAYFVSVSYRKIIEASVREIAYHAFMAFMMLNIAMIIFSFAVDFSCLNQVNPKSFIGIEPGLNFWETQFEFWYFSVLNFSFFGYGQIMPLTISAKIVIIFEVIISFLTIVFILSDFISLKESITERIAKKGK
ncbi:MAG: hypothetical protein ACKOXH_14680 [Aquirufa sp.]|jgi:hypothetical protein